MAAAAAAGRWRGTASGCSLSRALRHAAAAAVTFTPTRSRVLLRTLRQRQQPARMAATATAAAKSYRNTHTNKPFFSGDRVLLRGLVFYSRHGVLPEERSLGQRFVVDADVHADLRDAGRTDTTRDTVDYAAVFNLIRKTVEGPPYYNLVEKVAEVIAERVLDEHPRAEGVRVRVTKPHVAIQGVVTSLGVEIWRTREDMHREGREGSEAEARADGSDIREGEKDSETASSDAKVPGGKIQFKTGRTPY